MRLHALVTSPDGQLLPGYQNLLEHSSVLRRRKAGHAAEQSPEEAMFS
jgi:hypothetical protein